MPIKLPENLPAFNILKNEGVSVLSDVQASRQDIRPLRIALLNLMPKKIQTENQFSRLIGSTPLQIELSLIRMSEHKTKNTAAIHMQEFYKSFLEIKNEKFDGLIITGAPIEHLNYQEVSYWDELCEVFDWSQTNVFSTIGVCWGGMAMMYHAQEKNVNVPGSQTTGQRGGILNSVTRIAMKPTNMIGGYAQLSYSFNYYGTVGSQRDEIVVIHKIADEDIDWLERPLTPKREKQLNPEGIGKK